MESGAIVVGELDKTRFDNKASQLDQMPGAFAPFDGPFAHVVTRLLHFKTTYGCYCSFQRFLSCRKLPL